MHTKQLSHKHTKKTIKWSKIIRLHNLHIYIMYRNYISYNCPQYHTTLTSIRNQHQSNYVIKDKYVKRICSKITELICIYDLGIRSCIFYNLCFTFDLMNKTSKIKCFILFLMCLIAGVQVGHLITFNIVGKNKCLANYKETRIYCPR